MWKLSDYGIVRHVGVGSHAETATVKGTMAYMPPESFDGIVSPAWDVWSLGVILIEAVTGKRPFSGASDAELMRAIYTKEPEYQRPVPKPLDGIVQDCLNRDRKLRIEAAAIVACVGTGTIEERPLRPPPPPRPVPKPIKRLPSWLAVLVVAMAWAIACSMANPISRLLNGGVTDRIGPHLGSICQSNFSCWLRFGRLTTKFILFRRDRKGWIVVAGWALGLSVVRLMIEFGFY